MKLEFGLSREIPDGAYVAYGARGILQSDGVDILPDRQCIATDCEEGMEDEVKEELIDYLESHFDRKKLNEKVAEMVYPDYQGMGDAWTYTLYYDKRMIVKASTNRSFGYLYIVAYFHTDKDGNSVIKEVAQ
jgi:hypothetical protein